MNKKIILAFLIAGIVAVVGLTLIGANTPQTVQLTDTATIDLTGSYNVMIENQEGKIIQNGNNIIEGFKINGTNNIGIKADEVVETNINGQTKFIVYSLNSETGDIIKIVANDKDTALKLHDSIKYNGKTNNVTQIKANVTVNNDISHTSSSSSEATYPNGKTASQVEAECKADVNYDSSSYDINVAREMHGAVPHDCP